MIELIAIITLAICVVVILFVIRIYKESPSIKKKIEGDDIKVS